MASPSPARRRGLVCLKGIKCAGRSPLCGADQAHNAFPAKVGWRLRSGPGYEPSLRKWVSGQRDTYLLVGRQVKLRRAELRFDRSVLEKWLVTDYLLQWK